LILWPRSHYEIFFIVGDFSSICAYAQSTKSLFHTGISTFFLNKEKRERELPWFYFLSILYSCIFLFLADEVNRIWRNVENIKYVYYVLFIIICIYRSISNDNCTFFLFLSQWWRRRIRLIVYEDSSVSLFFSFDRQLQIERQRVFLYIIDRIQ